MGLPQYGLFHLLWSLSLFRFVTLWVLLLLRFVALWGVLLFRFVALWAVSLWGLLHYWICRLLGLLQFKICCLMVFFTYRICHIMCGLLALRGFAAVPKYLSTRRWHVGAFLKIDTFVPKALILETSSFKGTVSQDF